MQIYNKTNCHVSVMKDVCNKRRRADDVCVGWKEDVRKAGATTRLGMAVIAGSGLSTTEG